MCILLGTSTLRSPGLGQRSAGTVARRHAQANFIGVTDSATASKAQFPSVSGLTGLLVARLDYYLRLRVPMEQSIRLYLDKAKVLPLLAAFSEPDLPPSKKGLAVSEDKGDTSKARSGMFRGVNQLVISIVKASGLRSTKTDRLPSAYFVYQFYNLSEYMSMVQQATSAPVFEDVHTVSLRITPELDLYLRTSNLQVYLIDDAETDATAACLGVASIPLIGLARQGSAVAAAAESSPGDRCIRGLFELQRACEPQTTLEGIAEKQGSLGTIEVEIYWLFPYDADSATQDVSHSPLAIGAGSGSKREMPSVKKTAVTEAVAAVAQATVQSNVDATKSKDLSKAKTEVVKAPSPSVPTESDSGSLPSVVQEGREANRPRINLAADIFDFGWFFNFPPSILPLADESHNLVDLVKSVMPTVSETEVTKVENVNATDPDDTEPISLAISEELIDLPSPEQSVATEPTAKGTILSPKEPPLKSRRSSKTTGGDVGAAAPKPRPRSSSSIKSLPDRTPTQSPETSLEPTPRLPREKKDMPGDVSKQPIESAKDDITPIDTVKVCVHQLLLKPNAAPIEDSHQVYVEYSFLGLPEPVESPSKPVVVSSKEANSARLVDFEFSQVFPVDLANNYTRRQHLAKMLMKSDPNDGCITLHFVKEPTNNPVPGVSVTTKTAEEECVEYAEAKIDLRCILKERRDLLKEAIPVYPVGAEKDTEAVGEVTVTVGCLAALIAVSGELPEDAQLAAH
ncbi:unnamed protein product [Schistocephalus solidus]|uniref:C2 domain-containing protein n=1 Tax=Schistocephalus solidus TaxID=70667 RepID=A0A3P7EHG9_SCHSO|nr:unnamed protein product [Schistocephalus solidus]